MKDGERRRELIKLEMKGDFDSRFLWNLEKWIRNIFKICILKILEKLVEMVKFLDIYDFIKIKWKWWII